MAIPRLVRLRAARKRAKVPPRAVRWARSPQTPRGVELTYVLALKRIAARWGAKAQELLLPIAKRVIKPADAHTDEEDDSPYTKALNSLGSFGGAYADGTEFASAQISTAKKTVAHSKAEFQRIGVKLREAEPLLDKGIREWRSTNVDLVKSMLDGQRDILSDILTGYEGHSYDTIAKKIAERCNVASSRAEFIARDQVLKLNSNITTARMAAAGVAEFIWTTTGDERVRPMHEELDGQQFSFDDPPVTNEDGDENLPGEDYQCLPRDTQITFAGSVCSAFRRRYRGQLTQLVASSGETLYCTPNHPVLTASGWKSAEAVQVGDHVFKIRHQGVDLAEAQIEHGVARISDVFEALSLLGERKRVTGVATQFHGDGAIDEQVDVVDVDWKLFLDGESALAEGCREFMLAIPSEATARGRNLEHAFVALGFPSNGVMGCLCDRLADFVARIPEALDIGLAAIAGRDAGAEQEVVDRLALNPIVAGERLNRNPFGISAEAFALRKALSACRRAIGSSDDEAPSAERLGEIVGVASELSRDLAKSSAIFEQPLRIVEKTAFEFAEHVYNLTTVSGWYGAEFLVRNCRCVPTPIIPDFDDEAANDTTAADDAAPEPDDKPDEPLPTPQDFEDARIEILAPEMRPEAIAQVHAAFREVLGEIMRPDTIHELIGAEDIGANQVKYFVSQDSGSVNLTANIRHEDWTKSTIERSYSRDENGLRVSHDLLSLSETQRGKGLGKRILREQVAAYDRLGGAATIETSADRDGQYVWPNMGFAMTDAKQLAKVKTEFAEYLTKTYGLETATADSIAGKAKTITDLARTNLSTMALSASAPLETGLSKADEWKAGKRFLMGRGNDKKTSLLQLQVRRGKPEEATFRRYLGF